MILRPEEISSIIKKQIENYDNREKIDDVGYVIQAGDGIARVYGLEKCMYGELLEFEGGVYGMAMNLEEDNIGCVLFGEGREVKEGTYVKRTGKPVEVPVGMELIGRVVDPLGNPLDGKGSIETNKFRPIERPAPGVIDRKSVGVPLQTGIMAIDAMVPIES
jgi:F-type H+-transporting ATPase subunit alpha